MGRTKSCKKESKCSAGNGLTPSLGPRGGGVWWSSWRMWSWREMEIFVNNISWTCILRKVKKAPTPRLVNGDGERRGITENVISKTLWIFILRSQTCVFKAWIRLNHISLMTTSTATEYNERRSSESSTSSCCEAQLPADRPPSTINVVYREQTTCGPLSVRVQPSCSQHQDPS